MALEELAKIRPDVAKLKEEDALLDQKAAQEFSLKKGVSIDDALEFKGDLKLINELNRYIDEYTANYKNNLIPDDVKFEQVEAGGVPAEWVITPSAKNTNQVILYLFGGGYMWGSIRTRRTIPYLLGKKTDMKCLLIGYRLAPEHPFPAALKDSIAAYKWLLSIGITSNNIIIAGASAGGGLAVATMVKLRELGLKLPAAGILLSPWADLASKGESLKTNVKFSPLGPVIVKIMADAYLNGEEPTNPYASPIYADLKGLPPLLIHVGSIEILLDDSISLAKHAKSAGVDTTLEIWEGMPHVFHNFGDKIPDSKKALESIKNFTKKHLK